TAIVMLADAVEAASRALKVPSTSRIKGMVTAIVQERFKESELDECPLTLRDLTKIIDSFQTILLGTFHGRIEYPDQEEKLTPTKEKRVKEKNAELQD
ncbi:MAG TPA: phosphohydrolase, partial [bacterium]